MGRAIVRSPQVFLMDEPLSNLDAKLRVQTRTQIASLQRRLGVTTVYVTHDQTEAMTMGDRIAVLKDGLLQQCASPREMYDHPTTSSSPASSAARDEPRLGAGHRGRRRSSAATACPSPARCSVPPVARHRRHAPRGLSRSPPNRDGLELVVDVVEELGADAYVYATPANPDVKLEGGGDDALAKPFIARVDGRNVPDKGSKIYVYPNPNHMHVFNKETGQRMG
jgi:multiple sugar transport system ATP-binding protein